MKAFALVVITLTLLALPTRSVASKTSDLRVAYIPPSTWDAPWPAVCILDAATLASACPLPTEEGVNNNVVAWSPDGTMVATEQGLYRNGEGGTGRIVVLAADGSDHLANRRPSPAVVTGSARVSGRPMWSNDSRQVAVIGDNGIIMATLTGGHLDTLELGEGQIFDAAWSPDNAQFAIGRADIDNRGAALVLVNARTGAQKTLLHFAGSEIASGFFNGISWAPDGQRVLFTYSPPPAGPGPVGPSQHWVVDADGNNARMLYDSPVQNGLTLEARFSSDGQLIAFDGYSGATRNIFIMKPDGSDVHQLTHSATGAFRPRFDGDGRVLYNDLDGLTMNLITFASDDPEHGTVKTLLPAIEFEWAPAPGPLPANAVTPTATPTPAATPTPSPQQTATFQGSAWLNAHTSLGPIVGKIGGVACSEPSVAGFGPDSNVPRYTLHVVSGDVTAGCGREGAVVNFVVEGQSASQTAVWHAGSSQSLNLIAGPVFARFGGGLSINRTSSGESVVPFIGNQACGYDMTDGILGSVSLYDVVVYSAEQQAGCGVEGAQVTFKLLDPQSNVIAVAKEKGLWHAWDGVSDPQLLNLTMVPVGAGITVGNVGTGGSQGSGASVWASLSLVLASVGLGGIATGAALRRRGRVA